MCGLVTEGNKCLATGGSCPYMYFCTKRNMWLPNKAMPSNCKQKAKAEVPKGYYAIRDYRKGYLYIDVDNHTIKLLNPFETVPLYVKLTKTKSGEYRIKK